VKPFLLRGRVSKGSPGGDPRDAQGVEREASQGDGRGGAIKRVWLAVGWAVDGCRREVSGWDW